MNNNAVSTVSALKVEQVQISNKLNERLELLKRELDNNDYRYDIDGNIFMSVTNKLKEAYAQLKTEHRHYNQMTITHILHKYHTRFLELDSRWVDTLTDAEGDMKNDSG